MLVRARLHCFVFSDSVNCNYLFWNGATCARNISEREWWWLRRCSWFMTQTGLRTRMRLNFLDITIGDDWDLRWDDWKAELSNNIIFVITYDKFIIYAVLLVEATKRYHLEINNMVSNACWKGETVLPKEFCTGAPLLPPIYLDLFTCSGHVAEEEG